ncbi:HNH endonuclease signature motif containing protein [Rathayibacter caricis]|uniref:HNH endonuclease signature motif containing protein n=1 Tax=Rathayibacter caricis TaxID=110936 RepID=UPI002467C0AD|nr:HNH endonuclease signature motif containing protein [Rathayibacter caricis]
MLCGIPLIEYHHMDPWAEVKVHEEENLTLLCPLHHSEATKGLLTAAKIVRANANPVNMRLGVSAGYSLHYEGESAEVVLSTNNFSAAPRQDIEVIRIFGRPLLSFTFDEGDYFLNVDLMREDGSLAVRIVANELVYATDAWDVTFTGKVLRIRDGHRRVYLDVEFDTPSTVRVKKATFWHDHHYVRVMDDRVQYQSMRIPEGSGSSLMHGSAYGVSVGINIYDERVEVPPPGLVGLRSYPSREGEVFPKSVGASVQPLNTTGPRPVRTVSNAFGDGRWYRYGESAPH